MLIHEHRMSFHLFMFSSISFNKVLELLLQRSYTLLVIFLVIFFVFGPIVNGVAFPLISHINVMDFSMLILHPATLLNLLISSILWLNLSFLCKNQCHLQKVTSLLLPLCLRACVLRHSVLSDFATPWTVAHQPPLSMEFSRQEYWSRLPFPSPGDLPDPEIELGSPALQADSLLSEPPGKPAS